MTLPRLSAGLCAAVLAGALATPLAAQDAPARGHSKAEFLKIYDTDLDGRVTGEEYAEKRLADFARTDADGNGQLSEAEYVAEYAERLEAELAALRRRQLDQAKVRHGVIDRDRDGAVTLTEFQSVAKRTFDQLDTNGDGVIDDRDTAAGY